MTCGRPPSPTRIPDRPVRCCHGDSTRTGRSPAGSPVSGPRIPRGTWASGVPCGKRIRPGHAEDLRPTSDTRTESSIRSVGLRRCHRLRCSPPLSTPGVDSRLPATRSTVRSSGTADSVAAHGLALPAPTGGMPDPRGRSPDDSYPPSSLVPRLSARSYHRNRRLSDPDLPRTAESVVDEEVSEGAAMFHVKRRGGEWRPRPSVGTGTPLPRGDVSRETPGVLTGTGRREAGVHLTNLPGRDE